jgi:hypothetical protein
MTRLNVVTAIAATFCFAASACEGDAGLFTSRTIGLPALPADAGPMEPDIDAPPPSGTVPPGPAIGGPAIGGPAIGGPAIGGPAPTDMLPPGSAQPTASDAGALRPEPNANPAPQAPRAVVAEGPAAELPRLGIEGGEPRLGICEGGVVIGVRTTANPSEEIFGQRLTFIEPVCGKALHQLPDPVGDPSGTISVTRDDSMIAWAATDGFLGVPETDVPDPRLIWVLQPATICPEATPVVVGLSGEYDPVAPDVMDTAAIRSVFIECAPLILAPNGIDVAAGESGRQLIAHADSFAVGGAAAYRSACEGGAVTTQIKVHAGFWLDGFVLGCSSLRAE